MPATLKTAGHVAADAADAAAAAAAVHSGPNGAHIHTHVRIDWMHPSSIRMRPMHSVRSTHGGLLDQPN